MGKRWTEKEDNVLVTMRDAGTSYREIASIMGRTAQSCQQRIFALGKSKKHVKPKVMVEVGDIVPGWPVARSAVTSKPEAYIMMVQEATPGTNPYQEASYPLDLDYTFLKPKPTLLKRIIHKLFNSGFL